MDQKTVSYYYREAMTAGDRYTAARGGIVDLLPLAFSAGMKVLDIGC